jgi:hypothetical protein
MTILEAQNSENFEEVTDTNYKLKKSDRMKATGDKQWFPVSTHDVGSLASFWSERNWLVQKHISNKS